MALLKDVTFFLFLKVAYNDKIRLFFDSWVLVEVSLLKNGRYSGSFPPTSENNSLYILKLNIFISRYIVVHKEPFVHLGTYTYTYAHGERYKNIYRKVVQVSKRLETTQIYTSRRLDKLKYIYDEILHSRVKECSTHTGYMQSYGWILGM